MDSIRLSDTFETWRWRETRRSFWTVGQLQQNSDSNWAKAVKLRISAIAEFTSCFEKVEKYFESCRQLLKIQRNVGRLLNWVALQFGISATTIQRRGGKNFCSTSIRVQGAKEKKETGSSSLHWWWRNTALQCTCEGLYCLSEVLISRRYKTHV